jgi:hypothetical protein
METNEMQRAFNELNQLIEAHSSDVQFVRAVERAQGPQREEMIRDWMRKTLDEAVSIKARRPIETWLDNTKQVLATEENEEAKAFAINWKRELEEALAKINR